MAVRRVLASGRVRAVISLVARVLGALLLALIIRVARFVLGIGPLSTRTLVLRVRLIRLRSVRLLLALVVRAVGLRLDVRRLGGVGRLGRFRTLARLRR